MHSGECTALIRDACRIDPARRPLIIAGGPHAVYEPWDLFSADPRRPVGRRRRRHRRGVRPAEPARSAAVDVRGTGRVDALGVPPRPRQRRARRDPRPGVRARRADGAGRGTGRHRHAAAASAIWTSCRDPVLGYRLLEPPSRRATLGARALPADQVRRHSPDQLAGPDVRLQVRLPVLPDPRLQPAAAPRRRAAQRIAEEMSAPQQGVRPARTSSAPTTTSSTTRRARWRSSRRWPRPSSTACALAPARPLGHRGHRPRHAADEGAPAARARGRLPRPVAGRRGHDRHAGQEGPERRQDHRGVSRCCATPASARCR